MHNINYYENEEIIEDLRSLLGTQSDYEKTMKMLKLTEEEELIFNRATLQLKKQQPKIPILRRAYEILIAKSYHNLDINSYDDQAILGKMKPKQNAAKQFLQLLDTHSIKIVFIILLLLLLGKIL